MNDDRDVDPEKFLPANEADVIELAGAKTDKEEALAVAQARLIGDL